MECLPSAFHQSLLNISKKNTFWIYVSSSYYVYYVLNIFQCPLRSLNSQYKLEKKKSGESRATILLLYLC